MPGSGSRRSHAARSPARLTSHTRTALTLSVVLVVAGCTTAPDPPPGRPPESISIPTALRVGIAEPLSIDPARVDSPSGLLVIAQAFDPLVRYDPATRRLRPAAAVRWRSLEEGRVLEFTLRDGATFHDGSPIEAEDFVFAWNRLADPATRSPYAFLLESVAGYREFHTLRQTALLGGVQAAGPRTLRVELARPWPDFASLAAHPALAPVPPDADEPGYAARPIGNGPYRLAEPWTLGQPIVLERHEAYPGPAPTIDRLQFEVYDVAEEGWPDFLAGELDVATIPPPVLSDAQTRYGDAGIVTLARLLYCGFNVERPAFEDARLRRAFSLGIDREAIAATVYGPLAVPATGIVPPTVEGHDPGVCGANCERDVTEAARVVSGLPDVRRSFPLEVVASDVGRQLARTLAGQLETVGLNVRPDLLEQEAFGDRLREGQQRVFCLVWDADAPTQQGMLEPLLAPRSPDNHSNASFPRLTRALDAGRAATREDGRVAAYRRAERIALERLPIVPLVWFRSHLATQPYVRGFTLDPLGLFRAADIRLDPEDPAPTSAPTATGAGG